MHARERFPLFEKQHIPQAVVSLLVGISFALFVKNCWLDMLLPAGQAWLVIPTLLLTAAASAWFFHTQHLIWGNPPPLVDKYQVPFAGTSLLIGLLLLTMLVNCARLAVQPSSIHPTFVWNIFLGLLCTAAFLLPSIVLVRRRQEELADLLATRMGGSGNRFNVVDWSLLLGSVVLAFAVRIPNLDMWSLVGVDEYSHLIAAKWMVSHNSLAPEYQRSLWIVTLPVSIAFRLAGEEIQVARLTGVLFNVAAIVPLFLLTRRINRSIAGLSLFLYATSPWLIVFSRIIREYACHPFYILWIIYAMILFLERIPDRWHLPRRMDELPSPPTLALMLILCAPLPYAIFIDPQSTFRLVLIAYVVFGMFIFIRMDLHDRWNRIFLAGILILFFIISLVWKTQITLIPLAFTFNPDPLEYFAPDAPQQWFFEQPAIWSAAGLLAAVVSATLIRRKRQIPFFITLLFVAYLVFFVFSNNPYSNPRHLITAQLWYIILTATGLYLVWSFLNTFTLLRNGMAMALVVIVLGTTTFNIHHIFLSSLDQDSVHLVSQDYFYDLREIQTYLVAHSTRTDALVTTTPYGRHVMWSEAPEFSAIHFLPVSVTGQEILSILRQHPTGWIVMDQPRIDVMELAPMEFFANMEWIQFHGELGDEYVWYWSSGSLP